MQREIPVNYMTGRKGLDTGGFQGKYRCSAGQFTDYQMVVRMTLQLTSSDISNWKVRRQYPGGGAGSPYTMSFRFFRGRTLTTLLAGFALNMVSSPVNGLMPLRAFVAGFLRTLILNRPGTLNIPGPRGFRLS